MPSAICVGRGGEVKIRASDLVNSMKNHIFYSKTAVRVEEATDPAGWIK
jgi:hypothetical protein